MYICVTRGESEVEVHLSQETHQFFGPPLTYWNAENKESLFIKITQNYFKFQFIA